MASDVVTVGVPGLAASSRVVRSVELAVHARQLPTNARLAIEWPLREGLPWRQRLASLRAELGFGGVGAGAFTDELLARDAEAAGLQLVSREGEHVRFEHARAPGWAPPPPRVSAPRTSVAELRYALASVLRAEVLLRRHRAPTLWVQHARVLGARARAPLPRSELRALLSLVEPLVPGVRGCLRRLLAEIIGHAEAAHEGVVLGLTPHATGHASFAESTPWAPQHPVTYTL